METATEAKLSARAFEWGVIFAGAAIACAISVVLLQFGSAIGLSAGSPLRGAGSLASWGVIAAGIWLLWVQLVASLSGGYAAGILRTPILHHTRYENEIRDGLYGLTVWAISTLAVFLFVSAGVALTTYVEVNTQTDEVINVLTPQEKNVGTVFAFVAASSSVVSAAAAWGASVMGGHHRDRKVDFTDKISFLKDS